MASRDDIGPDAQRPWRLHGSVGVSDPAGLTRVSLWRSLRRGSVPRALHAQVERELASSTISVDDETVTLAQVWRQATALGEALLGRGVLPGEPAMLASPSSIDFIRCYLALLRVGSPVVLANPASTEPELTAQLAKSGARCAISAEQASTAVDRAAQSLGIQHLCLETISGTGTATGPGLPAMPRSNQVAILAFTSGTTGEPKMVPLRHGDIQASIRGAMRAWRWRPTDTVVHALPLFHQHGLSALHAAALSGSSLHCLSRFDPERLLDEFDRRNATVVFAVPTMWSRLAEAHSGVIRPTARLLVSGSAPLPPAVFDSIADKFGMMPLERYGTTETGLNLSNLYEGPRRPGSVGFALPGVETRVREATGELEVRGPQVFFGYDNASSASDDGWFSTGDLVERDPTTGAFSILGRTRELIISGGMNVYPREVENVLAAHAGIKSVAVVGVNSSRWGQETTAFFVSDEPVDVCSLKRFSKARLSPHKVPKRFHRLPCLPLNAVGKIERAKLEELGGQLNDPTRTT